MPEVSQELRGESRAFFISECPNSPLFEDIQKPADQIETQEISVPQSVISELPCSV
jgi:hypothetical protein